MTNMIGGLPCYRLVALMLVMLAVGSGADEVEVQTVNTGNVSLTVDIRNDEIAPRSNGTTMMPETSEFTDEAGQETASVEPVVSDDGEDDEDHPLYYISELLFLIIIPIITFSGFVNNILMFCVMRRPALSRTPVAIYMSALAVSDTLVLFLDFINNWVHFVSGYHLKSSSESFCQFHNFLFQSVVTYSSWLVVAVAVERFIVVWLPLKAKTICTVRKAVIVVSVMPVVCLGLQIYNFFIWKLNSDREERCDMNPDYEFFHRYVYSWLNNLAYCYIPVIILIFTNSGIIVGLTRANKARQSMGAEESNEVTKVTVTVVTICTSFVLLTVPLTLFYVIIYSSDQFVTQSPSMALGRQLVLIFGLSNYSINLFLYVLTSANFRRELRRMLRGDTKASGNRRQAGNSGTTTGRAAKLQEGSSSSGLQGSFPDTKESRLNTSVESSGREESSNQTPENSSGFENKQENDHAEQSPANVQNVNYAEAGDAGPEGNDGANGADHDDHDVELGKD